MALLDQTVLDSQLGFMESWEGPELIYMIDYRKGYISWAPVRATSNVLYQLLS